jgi:hypothetical protein
MLYQEKSGDPACFFQLRALPLQADRGRAEEHHLQRVQDRPLGLRQLPHHIHTAAQGTVFKICKKIVENLSARDRYYDFKNFFAEKFSKNIAVLLFKILLVFEKKIS